MNIVIARKDGGCTIRTVPEHRRLPGESDFDLCRRTLKERPRADFVEGSARPLADGEAMDRTFRNAWKSDLTVDMPKAREICRDRLRQMRAPLLAALDIEYLRADERGDTTEKQRIAARKQALRDAPASPEIDAARTPEELKAAIPEALKA